MIDLIRPDWPAPPNVRAFTTTRKGGFSKGPWSSLNLGDHCGDDPAHVEQNRELLRKLLPSAPRWLNQVHGTKAIAWEDCQQTRPEADAIFSTQPGQVCAVLTADCLPVLFCNKAGTKVAAAHAGWRGLAAGVLEATVAAMDCDPNELMAWMGPAIGPRAFEVGQDVFDSFVNLSPENSVAFNPLNEKWLADLYLLARLSLTRLDIKSVGGGEFCSHEDRSRFFSFRRDGETGRMASVIWLA